MYTYVYHPKEEVDRMHSGIDGSADGPRRPSRANLRYQIYQFFATDPEGRALEFQAFLHPIAVVSSQSIGSDVARIWAVCLYAICLAINTSL